MLSGSAAPQGSAPLSPPAAQAPPIWLQILTHLEQQEQRTCDRLELVVQLYHEPLRDKAKGYLTFAQHWSLFSNLSTLLESQRALLQRFSKVISTLRGRYEQLLADGYTLNPYVGSQQVPSAANAPVGGVDAAGDGTTTGPHTRVGSVSVLSLPPLPPPLVRRASSLEIIGQVQQQPHDCLVHEPSGATASSTPSSGYAAAVPTLLPAVATTSLHRGAPMVIDPLELLAGVVEATFADPCMSHFIAEHMMYTLNYGRAIFPLLTELIDAVISTSGGPSVDNSSSNGSSSSAAAPAPAAATPHQKELVTKTYAKLLPFLKSASLSATSLGLHKSYLPEVDPMAAKGPMWTDAAPVEELLLYLATPLSSLQRYVLAARCLIEAHCFSGAAETVLAQFVQTAALRGAEEGSLVLDQCSSQELSALIAKMDGFTAPSTDTRTLIHYGRLLKKFRRGRHVRLMFVFSDILCYVEELSTGRMRVRGLIPVESNPPLSIRDVDDVPEQNIQNCFEILAGGVLYVFFAESQPQKQHWMATLHYAVSAAQRRKHPNMVAKASSGDIITTVRSTWATTQPTSRLGRQRRDDLKLQMHAMKQHQRVISRVSSYGTGAPGGPGAVSSGVGTPSMAASAPKANAPAAVLGGRDVPNLSFASGSETPTADRESRRKAMARQSLRASFDVSHWNQMSTAHQRVRSQDVIGSLRTASGGGLDLLGDEQLFPPLPPPVMEQPMLHHLSMPPPVSPLSRAAAMPSPVSFAGQSSGAAAVRHVDPHANDDEHDDHERAADKASLLE